VRHFPLRSAPREETDNGADNPWVCGVMDSVVAEDEASVRRYPNVPEGANDPWRPSASGPAGGR